MAGSHVYSAVMTQLKVDGVELEKEAAKALSTRLAAAAEPALAAEGASEKELERLSQKAGADEAKAAAARLATALLTAGDGPYSREQLEAAFRGICPLWPFC